MRILCRLEAALRNIPMIWLFTLTLINVCVLGANYHLLKRMIEINEHFRQLVLTAPDYILTPDSNPEDDEILVPDEVSI